MNCSDKALGVYRKLVRPLYVARRLLVLSPGTTSHLLSLLPLHQTAIRLFHTCPSLEAHVSLQDQPLVSCRSLLQ